MVAASVEVNCASPRPAPSFAAPNNTGAVVESCRNCPGNEACRGEQLHRLVLKMFAALEEGGVEGVTRTLSRDEQRLFAELCGTAQETCWTRAFVLTVARKLSEFVSMGQCDEVLRLSVEGLLTVMDGLFARLPNGIALRLDDLSLDIYNQACVELDRGGSGAFLPVNLIGQAYAAFLRRKAMFH